MAALPALSTAADPLRDALNKITDWPGGTTTGAAPRADVVNLGTTVGLANDVAALPPDPFATELAALQASNDALAAELGIGTTPANTAPAVVPMTAQESLDAAHKAIADQQAKTAADNKAKYGSSEGYGMTEQEYIASKLGGYDWRGKASEASMARDDYYGGPMSSESAYIASKLGGYDWRGKGPQASALAAEYHAIPKK